MFKIDCVLGVLFDWLMGGDPCVIFGYYDSHSGTLEKGFELEWLHRTWRGVTSHPLMFTSGGAKPF